MSSNDQDGINRREHYDTISGTSLNMHFKRDPKVVIQALEIRIKEIDSKYLDMQPYEKTQILLKELLENCLINPEEKNLDNLLDKFTDLGYYIAMISANHHSSLLLEELKVYLLRVTLHIPGGEINLGKVDPEIEIAIGNILKEQLPNGLTQSDLVQAYIAFQSGMIKYHTEGYKREGLFNDPPENIV